MRCTGCGSHVPDGAKFCPECGTPVAVRCPACGTPSRGGRFCVECGSPLGAAPARPRQPPVTERRVTSVLFADLVGFTALAESRDAEETRELLSEYFTTARTTIARYGGTVEKFIGDAVMAVWGVPVAHEDDAERAVRAGLDLVAAVAELGHQVDAPRLALRVGIVTGEVAVTLGASGEGMVAGDAVNTAARVQAAAAPGEVRVDEATRALTAAAVSYLDAGEHALKGKSEPMRLFTARAVIAAVGGAQRVDGLEAPFVGRDRELRLVKELFHAAAEDGRPRLVAVTGAAGVGKSRLGWEFEKYADGLSQRVRWHRGRCLSYGEGITFWAFAEMVRSRLDATEGDPPDVLRAKLTAALDQWVPEATDRAWIGPPLAALLGLDDPDGEPPGPFTREELYAAWTAFLHRVSGGDRPVVLVFEDVQHAEPGLLDFIDHLIDAARFPLFVLTLARPELGERRPGWGAGRRATQIYLEPLPPRTMSELVNGLVEGLPSRVRDALVDRSEGVPLYAVEMVRALIDRDLVVPREGRYVAAEHGPSRVELRTLGAPASLHALIAARLDSLTPDQRQVVQDASVLGLAFARDALAAISAVGPVDRLDDALAALVRKEILVLHTERFSADRGQYRFVQALVRGVAYDTLSKRDRKARHLAVAAHLESVAQGDELAGIVAQHYLDALAHAPGDPDAPALNERALALLERAAGRAEALGAPEEALRHYLAALDRGPSRPLFARLAEGAARAALASGRAQDGAGWAQRAREAYDALGQPIDSGRAAALSGQVLCEQGSMQAAIDLLTPVYDALSGDPAAAGSLLRLAEELARAHVFVHEPDAARRYTQRALEIAEARQDWPSMVHMLSRYAVIWFGNRVTTPAIALLSAAVDLAREHHLPHAMLHPLANLTSFLVPRDLARATATGREALGVASQVAALDIIGIVRCNLCAALWLSGEWDELVAVEADQERMDISSNPADQLMLRFLLVAVLRSRGDAAAARAAATEGLPSDAGPQGQAYQALLQAAVAGIDGRRGEECALTADAVQLMYDTFGIDEDFWLAWPWAVESAVAVGDVTAARRLLALVGDAPPGLVPAYLHAQALRLRALVDLAAGEDSRVEADLSGAASALRAFGAPYVLARTLLTHGEWLAGQGRSGDAAPLLSEARAIFARLGAVEGNPASAGDIAQRDKYRAAR